MQNNYTNKEIKRIVTQNIRLPKPVSERIEETLNGVSIPEFNAGLGTKAGFFKGRHQWFQNGVQVAAAIAFLLCIGTVATVGAVSLWNEYAASQYNVEPKVQKKLVDEGVAFTPTVTVEKNGIKIETEQCIVDDKGYFYLLCKVTVPDSINLTDKSITFEDVDIRNKNGESLEACWESGIAGCHTGDYRIDPVNHVFYYEFNARELKIPKEGDNLTISFKDLSIDNEKKETEKLVKGEWPLNIKATPEKVSQTYGAKEGKLSCGAVVRKVEISPIGLKVEYNYKRQTKREEVMEYSADGSSKKGYTDVIIDPVFPNAYELKDGTKKNFAFGGGSTGFENDSNSQYIFDFELLNVVDVDEVAAIYFEDERVELVQEADKR